MEVSQALDYKYVHYRHTDRQTDRFENRVSVEGREEDGVFQAPERLQLPSLPAVKTPNTQCRTGSDKVLNTQAVVVYGRQTPLFLPCAVFFICGKLEDMY